MRWSLEGKVDLTCAPQVMLEVPLSETWSSGIERTAAHNRAALIVLLFRRRKESRHRDPTTVVIGDPVLVSYDSASPESMRMLPRPSQLDGT